MKKENTLVIILAAAVLLMTLFVFSNSLKGPEQSGNESGMVANFIEPLFEALFGEGHGIDVDFIVRKAAHFTEFCVLAVFCACLANSLKKRFGYPLLGYTLFYLLAVAVCDEFIQSFTGRGSSVRDVLIDFSGAAFGVGAVCAVCAIKKYVSRKNYRVKETSNEGTYN